MRRRILLLISFVLSSVMLSAAPARVVYYIMSQTATSVYDDSVLSVEFDITSPLLNTAEAGLVHPQPQITIILTNKTDKPLHLHANESKLMRNTHAQSIADFLANGEMVLAPHSSISFDDIPLLTQEAVGAFNNVYHHKHLKVLNNDYGMLCFGNLDKKFASRDILSYNAENSPVVISTSFVYSIGDDNTMYNIVTEYFAEKKVGSSLNAIGQEAEGLITEIFPDWMNPKYEVFKLWCLKP